MTITPIHHWVFDDADMVTHTVPDQISGGTALTFTAGKTLVAGKFGNGLSGDTDSKITYLPADTAFKTISMWIKRETIASQNNLILSNAAGSALLEIYYNSPHVGILCSYSSGFYYTNLSITENTLWHHLIIKQGTDNNHYILKLDNVAASAQITCNFAGLAKIFGRPSASGQYPVAIDNIQWYDRVTTDDEDTYLYNAGTQFITLPAAAYSLMRSILVQNYTLQGSIRSILDQKYAFLTKLTPALLDQIYSIRMLQVLVQFYGDSPQVRALLHQWYGSAFILQKLLVQKYGNAILLQNRLEQIWDMPDRLLQIFEQKYSIAGGQVQSLMDLVYDISEYNLMKSLLDQYYILSPGSIQLKATISVVTGEGLVLHPTHINGEADESEVSLKFEVHLSEEEYLQCKHLETEVIITVNDDVYHLIVEAPRRSRNKVGSTTYIVPLSSKAIFLDSPYCSMLTKEFAAGMASNIVSDIAALKGVEVDWQIMDWYIPASTLYANSETPLEVIRKIKDAAGGVLQSSKDGKLIVRYEYPDPVLDYDTVAPEYHLTANENFFSVNSLPEINDGFNKFTISNQNTGTVGNRIESVDIDTFTKEVHIYQIPFDSESIITLGTSGRPGISIQEQGVFEEIITEQVEIIAGEGQTQKPIYNDPTYVWKQYVLGAVTPSEDGHLSTEIKENSLVEVTYITKYRKFQVHDDFIEDVQFYCVEG